MTPGKNDVNNFWAEFGDAVVGSGVPEATAKWYVRWARKFTLSIKGKPLRERIYQPERRCIMKKAV